MLRIKEDSYKTLVVSKQQNLFDKLGNASIEDVIKLLKNVTYVDFDTETTGLDIFNEKVLLISLHICTVNLKYDEDGPYYFISNRYKVIIDCNTTNYDEVLELIKVLDTKIIVGHNIKFDLHQILSNYGIKLKQAYCTMLVEQLRTAGLRTYLAKLDKIKSDMYDDTHASEIAIKKAESKAKSKELKSKQRKGFKVLEVIDDGEEGTDEDQKKRARVYSLDAVLKRLFSIDLDKKLQRSFIGHKGDFSVAQIEYSGDDVIHLTRLRLDQSSFFKEKHYLCKLEFDFLQVLVKMERVGLVLNVKAMRAIYDRNLKEKQRLEAEFHKEYIRLVNTNDNALKVYKLKAVQQSLYDTNIENDSYIKLKTSSPKQMLDFFKIMGYNTLTGSGVDDFTMFRKTHPDSNMSKLIDIIIDTRQCSTILSKYDEDFIALINPKTGRIHTNIMQLGADTGRISSTNPNYQNVPLEHNNRHAKGIRECFNAGEGNVILSSDLAGQEVRIAATQSKEPFLLDRINGDIHSALATISFRIITGIQDLVISKKVNKEYRDKHKGVLFLIIYGGGPLKISTDLNIPLNLATACLKAIKAILPKLTEYQEIVKRAAWLTKKVVFNTITNRARYWSKDTPEFKLNSEACNAPIQGTAADMMKETLVRLDEAIEELKVINYELYKDVHIIMPIHDQIMTQCPNYVNTIGDVWELQEKVMVKYGTKYLYDIIPMEVETDVSFEWHH